MWKLPILFNEFAPKETMLAAYTADYIGTDARRFSRDKAGSSPGAKDFLIPFLSTTGNHLRWRFACAEL